MITKKHLKYLSTLTLVGAIALLSPERAFSSIVSDIGVAWFTSPNVQTKDVNSLATTSGRGISGTRQVRQTFQNAETFDVGAIVLSVNTPSANVDFTLRIFEVTNIHADTWAGTGAGTEFVSLTVPGVLVGEAGRSNWKITLTGSDVFTLAQRNSGLQGYGMELESVGTASVFVWQHAFDGTDYAPGRYYNENGTGSGLANDMGLALQAVPIPEPGSLALLGLGVAVVMGRRSRRKV